MRHFLHHDEGDWALARRRADEYDRALTHYHDLMRHRLLNPLAAIRGSALTLQQHPQLCPELHEVLLDTIVQMTERIEHLSFDAEPQSAEELCLQPQPHLAAS